MRNPPVNFVPALMVLLVACGAALGQAQHATEKPTSSETATASPAKAPPAAKSDKPKPSELEQMLAEALVNNPDIRVAEAKLREAEAELNRARFQVLQKVSTLHHALEAHKATVQAAEGDLRVTTPGPGRDKFLRDLALERAKLASLQAELPAVLGRAPQSSSADKKATENGETTPANFFRLFDVSKAHLSWLSGNPWGHDEACASCHDATGWRRAHDQFSWSEAMRLPSFTLWAGGVSHSSTQSTQGAMADKIHKALDCFVTVAIHGKPLSEALKIFQEKAPGIPFHIVLSSQELGETKVNLHLEQIPLGAALQALEDTFPDRKGPWTGVDTGGLRLAVREYGILVTTRGQLPPGAILLHDFWKGRTSQEQVHRSKAPDQTDRKGPPPEDIEGTIKAVDPGSGMVTISIGSDADLRQDDILEVYRLKPEPRYLGSIRVFSVKPTEAAAKPVRNPGAKLEVGDRVSSGIRKR